MQSTAAHPRLHCGGLRVVRVDLHRQCRRPPRSRRKGERMSTTTLDQPVKGPTFHPVSFQRRIKNYTASSLFLIAFVIALIPLVWVLFIVIERGWRAVTSAEWWTHSLQGVLPEQFAGGIYHALY